MMLRREQISDQIWVIYGKKRQDAAKAFVRFQEYYENVELKGKRTITVPNIENWWKRYRKNTTCEKDTYYTAWAGFNIPGRVMLDALRSSQFRNKEKQGTKLRWHREETALLKLLEDLSVEQIFDGYFIGMWEHQPTVLEHEVAHGFWATVPAYKVEQMNNLSAFPSDLYNDLSKDLKGMGYHADVVNDEMQAYLSSYPESLIDTFETDKYTDYAHPFAQTLKRYRKRIKPS